MEDILIKGQKFEGALLATAQANILMIKANIGFLGCGYFSIETADKLNEPLAIVTGVKNYDDMLEASIIKVSQAAQKAGINVGMKGAEALLIMNSLASS
ncbi:MAG: YunC family protein [Planctomycetes bacterium]|nr:YunC family protein [Planctomycetota bacterium]